MSAIPEHVIDVQPEFAALLGLSVAEVKALSWRELSNRAFDRGLGLGVSFSKALEGEGHLKLRVGRDAQEVLMLPHDPPASEETTP